MSEAAELLGNTWIWGKIHEHVQQTSHQSLLQPSSWMFILGAPGIGKSTAVRKECAVYDTVWLDTSVCCSGQELQKHFETACKTKLIQRLMEVHQDRVIVIDEVDALLQLDRNIASTMETMVNKGKLPHIPVICVGHTNVEKRLRQLFPKSTFYICTTPSDANIFLWLRREMGSQMDTQSLMTIAENCQGNLTHALKAFAMESTHSYMDREPLFADLFERNLKTTDIQRVLQEDPWLHPLRFHENVIKELSNRKGASKDKEKYYLKVLESLCTWDQYMSVNDSWYDVSYPLEPVAVVIRMLYQFPKKCKQETKEVSDFTKLFSNLSLQKKQEKIMYNDSMGFPWKHTQIFCDYIKYK